MEKLDDEKVLFEESLPVGVIYEDHTKEMRLGLRLVVGVTTPAKGSKSSNEKVLYLEVS